MKRKTSKDYENEPRGMTKYQLLGWHIAKDEERRANSNKWTERNSAWLGAGLCCFGVLFLALIGSMM